jgi:endonuclease/exonuclease/phosphatase family metal-dependent hydrolase
MHLLSWNTNHWQRRHYHADLWDYLDELNPDIALLQEAYPPLVNSEDVVVKKAGVKLSNSGNYVWHEIGGNRKWGSGVFTRDMPVRFYELKTQYRGALTVAEVSAGDTIITAISMYGLMEEGFSITTLHRMFSDLTFLLEGKRGLNRYIVLAGDFNASPQFDAKQPGFSHKILFDRIENFGLVDLFPYMPENPLQTWRSDKTDIPWQLDHCFVSKNLFNKVEKAEVLYNETIEKLSDHNPLSIKLNIT